AGKRAVMSSLLGKGVDRLTAERAAGKLEDSEEARAHALAERQAERLRGVEPAAAFRRLSGLLLRRGFGPGLAYSAARRAVVVALGIGVGAGFAGRRFLAASRIQSAESRAQKLVLEAEREAETKVRGALVEAKEEIAGMRREAEEDVRVRREEVARQQERMA